MSSNRPLLQFSIVLLVAFCMLAPVCSGQESRAFPASWQAAIDQFTDSGEIPGAVFLVKSPRWGLRIGTTGLADLSNNIDPDPNQHFRVGSVTKNFVGVLTLRLEQEGYLRLDDPISKYLTGDLAIDINAATTTIKECLQHTAGIRNYLNLDFYNTYPLESDPISMTKEFLISQINEIQASQGPYFNPMDSFHNPIKQYILMQTPVDDIPTYPWWFYSNSHYIVLGAIAEQVTGKPMKELIKEHITNPAGLGNTFYATDPTIPPNMMRGYSKNDSRGKKKSTDWLDVTVIDPTYAGFAGAVISTPMDLLKHLETIFTTEEILSKATREKWFTFVSADAIWENLDYGVGGLMQSHSDFGDLRGHGGAIPGYHNLMYYMPDSDTFFVIVVNTWDGEYEVDLMNAVMPLVMASTTTPKPSSGAEKVMLNSTKSLIVSWQAGRIYGDTYTIYLGENADSVDTATPDSTDVTVYSTSSLKYELTELNENTTYYWRVDAITASGEDIHGPLWTFKTGTSTTRIQDWRLLN